MKGKLTKLMMVAMVLVMALSLTTTALTVSTTTVSAATDKWSRMDLPTTLKWQMMPDSDIWDLTAGADGTLFALVEDTSGSAKDIRNGGNMSWDGTRWAVYPAWSDVSLFKSTDGGYTWSLMWHQPANDINCPVAVVPQPNYNNADANNDEVFVATGSRAFNNSTSVVWAGRGGTTTSLDKSSGGEVYRSTNGGSSFTKVALCPGVTANGTITSIDIAESACCGTGCPVPYMAIVGVAGVYASTFNTVESNGEGVWLWNEYGNSLWQDKMVANDLPPAPMTGMLAAGSGMHVLDVKASPQYPTDHGIMAVVVDTLAPLSPAGIYFCIYDGDDGYWGGDVDSVTNAVIGTSTTTADACMAVGDDYSKANVRVFVGLDGSNVAADDDVWLVKGLATVTGPSTAKALALYNATNLPDPRISDIVVDGNANDAVYVGCVFPAGTNQAQVMKATNALVWGSWYPSFKPPSGSSPVYLIDGQGAPMAAGGIEGNTPSGVSKCVVGDSRGHVYNGVGLLDDLAVSEEVPGADWSECEATAEEVSPTYDSDGLIYVSVYSQRLWNSSVYTNMSTNALWRLTGGKWERIMYEDLVLPDARTFEETAIRTTSQKALFEYDDVMWPRVSEGFSEDPYLFVLGGRGDPTNNFSLYQQMLWYSPDKGDTFIAFAQMPLGALSAGGTQVGLSESGWWVVDNKTIYAGDVNGKIYKTLDRGGSWTEGAQTQTHREIIYIRTSPIFSESGAAGTDKCVLIGAWVSDSPYYSEVWLSQDGCINDMENLTDEIYSDPGWTSTHIGSTVAQFDNGWASNHIIYAASGGWLDEWTLVGDATYLTRTDFTDVGVYRAVVNLNDPSASTWDQLWDADDYRGQAPDPQVPAGWTAGNGSTLRFVVPSGVEVGDDGTVYVPYTIWDYTYNNPNSGNGRFGRFTAAGVLRCLDGTAKNAADEIFEVSDGLDNWDGLWMLRAVPGSNHLIALSWDWKEWEFKLSLYEDTLSGVGPAAVSPVSGATGVGALMSDTSVSVPLSWQAKGGATLYEWQVSEDSAFTGSNTVSGETSDLTVTVPGLKASTTYFWRTRALEPMIGKWNAAQQFTTVIGGDTGAPKLITPEIGATISDETPLFTWEGIASATNYRVQVATSPTFGAADIVIDKTLGNEQAYEADKELVNGTYYWQVKGSNATTDTETPWSALGSFTLDTEAEGTSTPVWVWVLIVVGVVLAIIVLVLILRTRRPV